MVIRDVDSSDDDESSSTNVLLGFASSELTDDVISQLGGRPVCADNQLANSPDLRLMRATDLDES